MNFWEAKSSFNSNLTLTDLYIIKVHMTYKIMKAQGYQTLDGNATWLEICED